MKRLWFGVVFALLIVSSTVLAQDNEDLDTFISEDEMLTISYPEGWYAEEYEDIYVVFLAPDSSMIERARESESMVSGDVGIYVTVLPLELLMLTLPEEYDAADILTETITSGDEEDSTTWGEAELVEIELDEEEILEAGYAEFVDTDGPSEGRLYLYETEGIVVMVVVSAYDGEYTDELDDLGRIVATHVVYTGTVDDLMEKYTAGE